MSGSYRFGIQQKGGDIDITCVAPVHVSRDEFFTSLPAKLLKLPGLTKVMGIETAKVPLLDIEVRGSLSVSVAEVGMVSLEAWHEG